MERYIRTKDGRIYDTEVNGAWEQTNGIIGIPTFGCVVKIPQDFITKQADTIEELCDEVVVKETWRDRPEVIQVGGCSKRFDCARGLYLGKPTTESIKGAIWTSKGLTYVAKMNSKGELKLL